jgi:nucleoside phosphorylase
VGTLLLGAYAPEVAGVDGRAVGVGLVAAAAGTERVIADTRPERLLVIGTAGALPGSQLAIGSIVVVARAQLVVRAGAYVPAIRPTTIDADATFARACADALGAPLVTAASGVGVTSSDEEAARLAASAQIEHLESFAVLSVAAGRVPATCVLAIANGVGSRAHDEWRAHRASAEAAAIAAAKRLFQGA